MKLTINRAALELALGHMNRITEKRLANPILGYVLFETLGKDKVRLTATNLDMTMVDIVPCECEEEGAYGLPAGLLLDIVKKLKSDDPLLMESDPNKNVLKIKHKKTNFSVKFMDPSDFPPVNTVEFQLEFALNAKDLAQAVDTARVAVSQDSSRVQLNGIFVHYEESSNGLRFVSTDLFRIACVELQALEEHKALTPMILSKRTVNEVLHLLSDIEAPNTQIGIKLSQGQIMFEAVLNSGVKSQFSSRLVGGNFPEYKAALDVNNEKLLVADTKEFVDALERVSAIVSETSNSIRLTINQDQVQISGVSKEFGSAFDEIAANFNSTETFTICFNNRYLIEILKQIETAKVEIYFNAATSPAIVKPFGDDGSGGRMRAVFVIMPVEIIGG